jgi:hypothetical protein
VPVRIVENGGVRVDQSLPWGRMVSIQARVHLPSHRDQLAGLRS